ncbi:hypothetical protein DPX16_12535 [Anabarilius grahami]|uniref:Uncharacterized protein n=1 Tax=Anabarilius grahami TaxID=495550 RepID=A0A3N0XRA2_ANAGA|nr:hypothetical protein DPX16_12535 [Anabarilius grahami]
MKLERAKASNGPPASHFSGVTVNLNIAREGTRIRVAYSGQLPENPYCWEPASKVARYGQLPGSQLNRAKCSNIDGAHLQGGPTKANDLIVRRCCRGTCLQGPAKATTSGKSCC